MHSRLALGPLLVPIWLALVAGAQAQEPAFLVRDIKTSPESGVNSDPEGFVRIGGRAFFAAQTAQTGSELWSTDGTEAGTYLVKEIGGGGVGSAPRSLAAVDETLFFFVGDELWRSDGTEAGTVQVKDLKPGNLGNPGSLAAVNGALFFAFDDGTAGVELWKSDGTADGTIRVKDIRPGPEGSGPAFLTGVNGTLFFSANDGVTGTELWKSDGTEAGTVRVKDILGGSESSAPEWLTDLNGVLYFSANDGVTGVELWRSDGTDSGTTRVKNIGSLTGLGDPSSRPSYLTEMGGFLFFAANGNESPFLPTGGPELWKSDGTEAGTVRVNDIEPKALVEVDGTLFFWGIDSSSGWELWKSDGTAAGTLRVKDIHPGSIGSNPGGINPKDRLTVVDGSVFFVARDAGVDFELWKSDGTDAGTVRVKDIRPGPQSAFDVLPDPWIVGVNGWIVFSANDGTTGRDLWVSDGTEAGTKTMDLATQVGGARPMPRLARTDGTLFFSANDGTTGIELWKSDGTEAGTVLVKDIRSGPGNSLPDFAVELGGRIFFTANDGITGFELWRSDGTEAGTVRVKDIQPGPGSLFARLGPFSVLGEALFFAANDTITGSELWRSDGTEAGTVLVKDIFPGSAGSFPGLFADVNGTLFFRADDGSTGSELWKTDGTAEGTVLVKDIRSGPASSGPSRLTAVGGKLFFVADDGVAGLELWTSDGTEAGTVLVSDIVIGSGSPFSSVLVPTDMIDLGGSAFFGAMDDAGIELWRSDGTAAGTSRVKDIAPGSASSLIGNALSATIVQSKGLLFFTANDGVTGSDLWRTDGTESGTVRVKDFDAAAIDRGPGVIRAVDSGVILNACDSAGCELWESDGTEEGTRRLADVEPGPVSSEAGAFLSAGALVYFTALTAASGYELWAIPKSALFQQDGDGDGILDEADNCLEVANADQADLDLDGYGQLCDTDYDQDGLSTVLDLGMFRSAYASQVGDARYRAIMDHDADGVINTSDLSVFKQHYLKPAGPSGVACAGVAPCP